MTRVSQTDLNSNINSGNYEHKEATNKKPSLFLYEEINSTTSNDDNFYGDALSLSHDNTNNETESNDISESSLSNKLFKNYTNKLKSAIDIRYNELLSQNIQLSPTESDYDENQIRWKGLIEQAQTQTNEKAQKIVRTLTPMLPDLGNGKIDKTAKQIGNDCWLIGGINALSVTDAGKKILNNNIYKDEDKHLFAIHLQEAENNKMPQPKGDGIYIFTEKEIFDAQKRNSSKSFASGDGDITAYALAIDKYLEDSNNGILPEGKQRFSDGQHVSKIFEILTGKKRNGADNYIEYKFVESGNEQEIFDKLYSTTENEKGAITVNIGNHTFSIVGVDNSDSTKSLLMQESNLSEVLTQDFELVADSYPPTYKLPLDKFDEYVHDYGILKYNP